MLGVQIPDISVPDNLNYRFFTHENGFNLRPNLPENAKIYQASLAMAQQALRVDAGHLLLPHQVHGKEVLVVTSTNVKEYLDQAQSQPELPIEADAIITNVPRIGVGIITADCVPVLLYASRPGVVAAIHCGWRSAFQDILAEVIKMFAQLGAMPSDITAMIGPGIAQPSYQVDQNFHDNFLQADEHNQQFFRADSIVGKYLFDLPGFCNFKLQQQGVEHIHRLALDTYADTKFFSFRREGDTAGRQLSAIVLNS